MYTYSKYKYINCYTPKYTDSTYKYTSFFNQESNFNNNNNIVGLINYI